MLLIAVLVGAFVYRLHAIDMALQRDEGAYAYIGSGWRSGLVPYRDSFDHKPPLVYAVYALVTAIQDRSPELIRLSGTLYFLGSGVSVWVLARHVLQPWLAVLATGIYVMAGSSHLVDGLDLNTEHLLVLPATLACHFALRACRHGSFRSAVASGLLVGIAVSAKQVGALLLPVLGSLYLYYAWNKRRSFATGLRLISLSLAGIVFAIVPWLLYFWWQGALPDFLYGAIQSNISYVSMGIPRGASNTAGTGDIPAATAQVAEMVPSLQLSVLRKLRGGLRWLLFVPEGFHWLFATAALGAAYGLLKHRTLGVLGVSAYFICSWIGAKAGFNNFPHYFVTTLPAVSILVVYGVDTLIKSQHSSTQSIARRTRQMAGILIAVTMLISLSMPNSRYLAKTASQISLLRFGEDGGTFTLSQQAAQRARALLDEPKSLYVAGAEPQIYWYADKRAPTKYIYEYPFKFVPGAREEAQSYLKTVPPGIVVLPNSASEQTRQFFASEGYEMVDRVGPIQILRRD